MRQEIEWQFCKKIEERLTAGLDLATPLTVHVLDRDLPALLRGSLDMRICSVLSRLDRRD
jgi:hypothetical protein